MCLICEIHVDEELEAAVGIVVMISYECIYYVTGVGFTLWPDELFFGMLSS